MFVVVLCTQSVQKFMNESFCCLLLVALLLGAKSCVRRATEAPQTRLRCPSAGSRFSTIPVRIRMFRCGAGQLSIGFASIRLLRVFAFFFLSCKLPARSLRELSCSKWPRSHRLHGSGLSGSLDRAAVSELPRFRHCDGDRIPWVGP